jgi:demethylmenaquinone methyltransferase/2-methoxy-6-polyprenyl-1,4-benzoquinol methylase
MYVLMRILESAPGRYDKGLRVLTFGRLESAYDRLVSHVKAGQRVLDLGCGTGALALRSAARGASGKGIDVNSQMLEIARQKAEDAGLADTVHFCEMGVAELDNEEPDFYDVVMSGLCFSELTADELTYALEQAMRILKPGGLLLLADEVVPGSLAKRLLNSVIRVPLAIIAYVWTQTTTQAVSDLPQKVEGVGFVLKSIRLSNLGSLMELVARKPVEDGE